TLDHHTRPINVSKLSADGLHLMSGGDDCKVCVWNLCDCGRNEPQWSAHIPDHSAVCSSTWALFIGTSRDTAFLFLIIGCADGLIHIYCQADESNYAFMTKVSTHSDMVEDLTFNPYHSHLASIGGGQLIMWNITSKGALSQGVVVPPRDSTPQSVRFLEYGASIIVLFLQSHEFASKTCLTLFCRFVYNVEPWAMNGNYILPTRIGHAAVGCTQRTVLVSNLSTGVDVYNFLPMKPIKVLHHLICHNVSLLAVAALSDAIAIVGSDDGTVHVFDQRTGSLVTTLHHSPSKLGTFNSLSYS
ncbi:hypothetical protein AN958_01436, partial [Leucoagaricus sp. SymC.cos]